MKINMKPKELVLPSILALSLTALHTSMMEYHAVANVENGKVYKNQKEYLVNNGWTKDEAAKYQECSNRPEKQEITFDPLNKRKPALVANCMKKT